MAHGEVKKYHKTSQEMDKEVLNIHGAAHAYLHSVGFETGHLEQSGLLQK